jgi:hypothetical protein
MPHDSLGRATCEGEIERYGVRLGDGSGVEDSSGRVRLAGATCAEGSLEV